MSIKTQVNRAIQKVFSSGKAQEYVEAAADKAVKEAIDQSFRSFGTKGKLIQDFFDQEVDTQIFGFDLDAYNNTIMNMVRKVALEHLESEAERVIADRMAELLHKAPKETTVQDMVDFFIQEWKDEGNFSLEPEIEIEPSSWCPDTSCRIRIWKDDKMTGTISRRENTADIDLHVSDNRILNPRLSTRVFTNEATFNIESYIYQMTIRGTKITDAHTIKSEDINVSLYDD